MKAILLALLASFRAGFRSRITLQLEVLALRPATGFRGRTGRRDRWNDEASDARSSLDDAARSRARDLGAVRRDNGRRHERDFGGHRALGSPRSGARLLLDDLVHLLPAVRRYERARCGGLHRRYRKRACEGPDLIRNGPIRAVAGRSVPSVALACLPRGSKEERRINEPHPALVRRAS